MNHFILGPKKKHRDKKDPGKGPTPSEEIPEPQYSYEHEEVDNDEGSEYLDDALRMKDQPFGEINTEENE